MLSEWCHNHEHIHTALVYVFVVVELLIANTGESPKFVVIDFHHLNT